MNRWMPIVVTGSMCLGCVGSDPSTESTPTLSLHEHTRLGTVEGGGGALTDVSGVLPHDSLVFVLESFPARLTLFSRSGSWLGDLAKEGDGPGELRRPALLGLTGEEVWVGDPAGGRLETFTEAGAANQSFRWDIAADSLGGMAFPTALMADGSVLAGPGMLSIGGAASGRITHRSYYRTSVEGVVRGHLYRQPLEPTDFFSASVGGGGALVGVHPVRASPLVSVFPDGSGVAVVERPEPDAEKGTYRLLLIGADGAVQADQSVPFVPLPAEGWLEREIAKRREEMAARGGASNDAILAALRDAWAPRRYYPPVSRLVAGAEGTVWVRREEAASDSTQWQVFDRSGKEIGRLTTPASLTIHWASQTEAWGVITDEMDVPFVVGFAVKPAARPN